MLFGEKSPELSQDYVEAYFEDWRNQVATPELAAVIAPHPTDSNFVLRGRPLQSINGQGERIEEDLKVAAEHHQILTQLGLTIPVYEHAICRQAPNYRPMLYTAVERVIPQPLSSAEERDAKNEYRNIMRKYFARVDDGQLPYFLHDIKYPVQGMVGTGALDMERKPKLQLLDVEPRIYLIRRDEPDYPELYFSGERRYIDNVSDEQWHKFSLAQPRFDEHGCSHSKTIAQNPRHFTGSKL